MTITEMWKQKMTLESFQENFKEWVLLHHKKLLFLGIFVLLTLSLIFEFSQNKKMNGISELPEMENVDQFIPEGFALVPIQLINGQALSQAIGRYGIVDLYLPGKGGRSAQKVGHMLRILKMKNDPTQFQVLAPEIEVKELVEVASPLFAVIQNPKLKKTSQITVQKKPRTYHIEVQE